MEKLNIFKINKEDLKSITIYFIVSRVILFAFMYFCLPILQEQGRDFWTLNDSEHYIDIAIRGYKFAHEVAFFPFLPILIRIFGKVPVLLLNIFLSYCSSLLIYQITKENFKDKSPLITTNLWIYSPIAVFTCLLYTESIFVFLTLLVYYLYKHKRNYILQGVLLGLAVCTRSPASIVFFVIFLFMCINVYKKEEKISNIIKMYIPATIISCLYPAYLQIITGNWNSFASVQFECWSKSQSNIFKTIWYSINGIFTHTGPYRIVCIADAIFYLFFIILILYSIVKYRKDKNVYDILLITLLTLIVTSTACVTVHITGTSATVSYYRYFYGCMGYILLLPTNKLYYYLQRIIFFVVTGLFLTNIYFY